MSLKWLRSRARLLLWTRCPPYLRDFWFAQWRGGNVCLTLSGVWGRASSGPDVLLGFRRLRWGRSWSVVMRLRQVILPVPWKSREDLVHHNISSSTWRSLRGSSLFSVCPPSVHASVQIYSCSYSLCDLVRESDLTVLEQNTYSDLTNSHNQHTVGCSRSLRLCSGPSLSSSSDQCFLGFFLTVCLCISAEYVVVR